MTSNFNLLDQFLGEYVILFITNLPTSIQSESGEIAEIPTVVEGIFYDYDDAYLMLGNDLKTSFTLVNRDMVAKLDITDATMDAMTDPSKPQHEDMN